MFRSAATKIAHNSTIPALAGNKDLKLLQDVIASEKAVLQSLSKLGNDFTKSSEALRSWGAGEGEDLADTFSACTTLMAHYSSSLISFSNHTSHIRECLKAVRTREEALDETHRRRKSLLSKADSAEKKLNKMTTDHKNHRQQTDILLSLREQIRTLDVEIMDEEAALSDWKRVKAREWMAILFGGLLECSEKGYVVATICRSIISYIPLDQTEPGLARVPYSAHAEVEHLLVQAERELHKVTFTGELKPDTKPVENHLGSSSPVYRLSGLADSPPQSSSAFRDQELSPSIPHPNVNNTNEFGAFTEPHGSYSLGPSRNEKNPPSEDLIGNTTDRRDGAEISPTNRRFSTLPTNIGSRPADPAFSPSHHEVPSQSSGFSGASFTAKDRSPHPISDADQQSFSSSVVTALPTEWKTGDKAPHLDGSAPRSFYQQSHERQLPSYIPVAGPPPSYIPTAGPPPGAAPAVTPGNPDIENHIPSSYRPEAARDDPDDKQDGLAYMSQDDPGEVDNRRMSREDKGVRFGSVRDIDTELRSRHETQERDRNEEPRPSSSQQRNSWTESSQAVTSPQPVNIIPPPPPPPLETPESTSYFSRDIEQEEATSEPQVEPDENSLNAMAAREISKQMDSLVHDDLVPPSVPFASRRSVSPRPSVLTDMPRTPPVREMDRLLSPVSTSGQISPQIYQQQGPRDELRSNSPFASRSVYDRSGPHSPDTAYYNPAEYPSNDSANGTRSPSNSRVSPVTSNSAVSFTPSTSTFTSPTSIFTPSPTRSYTPPASTFTPSSSTFPTSSSTAPKTISAAAFRRPNTRFGGSSTNLNDGVVADTSPLNVRKRTLPSVPSVASSGGPRSRSASNGNGAPRGSNTFVNQGSYLKSNDEVDGRTRASKVAENDTSVLDEDFDYISAYVDDGRRHSQAANSYGS